MGMGLHYASIYQVKWEGGFFDIKEKDRLYRFFIDMGANIDSISDEAEQADSFQITREDLHRVYDKLYRGYNDPDNQTIEGYPVRDLLFFIRRALFNSDMSDEWVHFYWF